MMNFLLVEDKFAQWQAFLFQALPKKRSAELSGNELALPQKRRPAHRQSCVWSLDRYFPTLFMKIGRSSQTFLLALAALILQSGCASFQPGKPHPPKPPRPPVSEVPASARKSYWAADGVEGRPWIVIVLDEQRAYFFRDQTVVGESKISSGKKRFETPPGEYSVIQKDKNHASNLYGKILSEDGSVLKSDADMSKDKVPPGGSFVGAKMPYFLRFHRGYGLHAGRVPNSPASHGCVRLPSSMAPHFFEHAEMGTPVSVIPSILPEESTKPKKPAKSPKARKAPSKKKEFRWPWEATT